MEKRKIAVPKAISYQRALDPDYWEESSTFLQTPFFLTLLWANVESTKVARYLEHERNPHRSLTHSFACEIFEKIEQGKLTYEDMQDTDTRMFCIHHIRNAINMVRYAPKDEWKKWRCYEELFWDSLRSKLRRFPPKKVEAAIKKLKVAPPQLGRP